MPITPLPTPVPTRADPANFAVRADAFLAALPTFATEANALEANVDAAEAVCLSVAQTVNVTAWSSVTSYAVGANVYDATTLLTYRRKTAGSGGLRPGLNGTDWQLLTGFGDVDTASNQTIGGVKTFSNPIAVASGGTGAATAAAARANLEAVGTSGSESIAGVKTFSAAPVLSAGATVGAATLAAPSGGAPLYPQRAWAKWQGATTGTNAPTAGGNVSTVQRVQAGVYRVAFTTAMPTSNYAIHPTAYSNIASTTIANIGNSLPTTTSFIVTCVNASGTAIDPEFVTVSVTC